jgi:predicted permease
LIGPTSIAALSKILFNLFLPCFMFCSVIKTVTTYGMSPSRLAMPFAAALQITLALAISRKVTLPLLGIDPSSDAGKELSLCATFHNPGSLPLLFFDALFRSPYPNPAVLPQMVCCQLTLLFHRSFHSNSSPKKYLFRCIDQHKSRPRTSLSTLWDTRPSSGPLPRE